MKNAYNLLYIVALKAPCGTAIQGAIGEKVNNDGYLVEFCHEKGRVKELLSLPEK